ncbi:MAG: hypothetical protein LIO53_00045 [Oscillospiraceae bacterium]|nr:hypothetical protein [Oscillospiraceae bacterium]
MSCGSSCRIGLPLYALSALFTLIVGLILGAVFPTALGIILIPLIIAAVILFFVILFLLIKYFCCSCMS